MIWGAAISLRLSSHVAAGEASAVVYCYKFNIFQQEIRIL